VEVVVSTVLMVTVVGAISSLVGATVRGKLIVSSRSADTQTARQTLQWMSERLRNAGLNILPSAQSQDRCKDMVVAQDASLRPQSDRIYISGEIINTNTTAGDEVITLGYRVDNGVVVEDAGSCSGTWSPTTSQVSDPRVTVNSLQFRYFQANGAEVAVPTTDVTEIQAIRLVQISMTVTASEGTSGPSTQTFTRLVMFRNPPPDTSIWLIPTGETNP
jgi:hypothetical protein